MSKLLLILSGVMLLTSCRRPVAPLDPNRIIALERTALDRWGKGEPQGYLETYAPEITYYDPGREKRADGIQAMTEYYAPLVGKIKVARYEMIDAKVQPLGGEAAVLSYQLISHAIAPNGSPFIVRWNSTKVYRQYGQQWKLVHDHWSFIKPELKNPFPGPQ